MVQYKFILLFFLIIATFISCNDSSEEIKEIRTSKEVILDTISFDEQKSRVEDTTFYLFEDTTLLTKFIVFPPEEGSYEPQYGSLSFLKVNKLDTTLIFIDTLYFFRKIFEIKDYNGDKKRDLAILNTSSARSVWTFHLFLVDEENKNLKRVVGFEEIYGPTYDSINNIIIGCAIYGGTQDYSFYRITNDSLVDLGFSYSDDGRDEGDKYENTIKNILKKYNKN